MYGGREWGEAEGCHAPGCRPPPSHGWSPGRHGLSQTHSEVARGKCHQRGSDLIQWDPSPYKRKRHQSSLPSSRTQREGLPDCKWEGGPPRPWHARSPAAGFQPPEPGGAGRWHSLGRLSRRRLGPEGGLCVGAPSSTGPVPDTITGETLVGLWPPQCVGTLHSCSRTSRSDTWPKLVSGFIPHPRTTLKISFSQIPSVPSCYRSSLL